jgi:transposase
VGHQRLRVPVMDMTNPVSQVLKSLRRTNGATWHRPAWTSRKIWPFAVEKCPEAGRLRTHPGVGALTALAFVLIIGRAERFQCGKQIAAYLGLVPLEDSSGNRRRLGHITKQGSSMLRFLLVEAAQVSARSIPEWRNKYFHLAMRRGRKIAKVAMARRLAIALYWMWRKGWDYEQSRKFGSHAGQLGPGHGVQ